MEEFGQKRVLIAGGAGFIGSHLCGRYLEMGYEVICLDNFLTGRRKNIEAFMPHPRFELVRHDITQPYMAEVDLILNFACPASPIHYQANPIKTLKTSLLGSLNLLGLAKRVGARLTHASTSEVYGDPQIHPQPEFYWGHVNPIGIRSCYDEGKRAAETLCFDYNREHGVAVRVARIFNTFGPRMEPDDGRVVSNFIVQALQGKDITIYGDGSQTRSFCFIDDLLDGLIALTHQNSTIGPINLGNDQEFSILQLAEKVIEMTGGKSSIAYKDLPKDDPKVRCPDLSMAQRYLGYKAQVTLEQGLEETIRYFTSTLDL